MASAQRRSRYLRPVANGVENIEHERIGELAGPLQAALGQAALAFRVEKTDREQGDDERGGDHQALASVDKLSGAIPNRIGRRDDRAVIEIAADRFLGHGTLELAGGVLAHAVGVDAGEPFGKQRALRVRIAGNRNRLTANLLRPGAVRGHHPHAMGHGVGGFQGVRHQQLADAEIEEPSDIGMFEAGEDLTFALGSREQEVDVHTPG